MINKRSIWFLTLFSLILVLSVYYITMPSELLLNTNANYNETTNKEEKNETTYLVSLKLEKESNLQKEMEALQIILMDNSKTISEKNDAYNKIKDLNSNKALEEKLESLIKEKHNLEAYIKIKGDQIEVIVNISDKSTTLANNIMRSIQENFKEEKYITVKFIS